MEKPGLLGPGFSDAIYSVDQYLATTGGAPQLK